MAYVTDMPEGWYAVTNREMGLGFGVRFSKDVYKYPLVLAISRWRIRAPLVRAHLQRRTRTLHKLDQRGTG